MLKSGKGDEGNSTGHNPSQVPSTKAQHILMGLLNASVTGLSTSVARLDRAAECERANQPPSKGSLSLSEPFHCFRVRQLDTVLSEKSAQIMFTHKIHTFKTLLRCHAEY